MATTFFLTVLVLIEHLLIMLSREEEIRMNIEAQIEIFQVTNNSDNTDAEDQL